MQDPQFTTKEMRGCGVMFIGVCALFTMNFFILWEALGILDPVDEVDLFVLHCVYLPRINRSLKEFMRAWNLHPIRQKGIGRHDKS